MQLACVYALASRTKPAEASSAIRHLQRALASDPRLARRAATDSDLAAIQSNTEFQSIMAAAARLTESTPGSPQQPSKPSEPSPERAAQDDAKQQRS
jgi:hypothetical protein